MNQLLMNTLDDRFREAQELVTLCWPSAALREAAKSYMDAVATMARLAATPQQRERTVLSAHTSQYLNP